MTYYQNGSNCTLFIVTRSLFKIAFTRRTVNLVKEFVGMPKTFGNYDLHGMIVVHATIVVTLSTHYMHVKIVDLCDVCDVTYTYCIIADISVGGSTPYSHF